MTKQEQEAIIKIFEELDKMTALEALERLQSLRETMTKEEKKDFLEFVLENEEHKELILRVCRKVYSLLV